MPLTPIKSALRAYLSTLVIAAVVLFLTYLILNFISPGKEATVVLVGLLIASVVLVLGGLVLTFFRTPRKKTSTLLWNLFFSLLTLVIISNLITWHKGQTLEEISSGVETKVESTVAPPTGGQALPTGGQALPTDGQAPPTGGQEEQAIAASLKLYQELKNQGMDFTSGPCLSNEIISDWVLDVVHDPRLEIDNQPENQCSAYREGKAHHFVELDPEGNLIRTY